MLEGNPKGASASRIPSAQRSAQEMKRFLHNVAERFRSMRDGRHSTVYDLSWDQSAVEIRWLTMENESGALSFPWDAVSTVDTFKRDQFTVDCICLAFETPDGWIEVNEDMNGWGEFLDAVELSLPGFPPQEKWWRKVMVPAFETNHATLWKRGVQNHNLHPIPNRANAVREGRGQHSRRLRRLKCGEI